MPSVAAVTVNYGTPDLVMRAVDSLLGLDYPPDRLRVVVVDNPSGDDSATTLRDRYGTEPRVTVVEMDHNAGFGGGNNAVLDDLEDDYALLLNSDAFAADPDALTALLRRAEGESRPVGAVAPKILLDERWLRITIAADPTYLAHLQATDSRVLGVALFGATLDGNRLTAEDLIYESGFYDLEWTSAGSFRWTVPDASLLVRVPRGRTTGTVELAVLGGPSGHPTTAQVTTGTDTATVDLRAQTNRTFGRTNRLETIRVAYSEEDLQDAINNAGSFLTTGFHGFDRGYRKMDVGQFEEPQQVFAFCGAAALLSGQALREVGTFDHRFFLYYEDTDLSWRMRHGGWDIVYEPGSVFRHTHSASSVEWSDLFTFHVLRNRILMLVKNAHARAALIALGGFLLTLLRQLPTAGSSDGRHTIALHLRVLWSLIGELPRAITARRGIRSAT